MDPATEHTDELRQLCPGRFTKVSLHNQAGEIEARLSEGGNWELRIRREEETTWRMACSGDLDSGAITAEPVGPALGEEARRLGPLEIDPAARTASVDGTDVVLAKKEFALLLDPRHRARPCLQQVGAAAGGLGAGEHDEEPHPRQPREPAAEQAALRRSRGARRQLLGRRLQALGPRRPDDLPAAERGGGGGLRWPPQRQRQGQGQLCELGRYAVPEEARVLVGQRIDGVVHVFDWPAAGPGRRYHVEAGFESKAELAVLVAEYRRRAERLGVCPMSRAAIDRACADRCWRVDEAQAIVSLAGDAVDRSGPLRLADLPRAAAPPSSGPLFGPAMTDPQHHTKKPHVQAAALPAQPRRALRGVLRLPGERGAGLGGDRPVEGAPPHSPRRAPPRGRQVRRAMAERGGDAAAVRAAEIDGYGSSATWR